LAALGAALMVNTGVASPSYGVDTLHVWFGSETPTSPYDSWETAAHTIQEAVDAADSLDVVLVKADTTQAYTTGNRRVVGECFPGGEEYAPTFVGSVVFAKTGVTICGEAGGPRPIISGEDTTRCVVFPDSVTRFAVVERFVIRNGAVTALECTPLGGGVFFYGLFDSTDVLRDCVVESCHSCEGGGLANHGFDNAAQGGMLIENCVFQNNYISPLPLNCSSSAGAIRVVDVQPFAPNPIIIRRNIFRNNSAPVGGGAIRLENGNTIIEGNLFESNRTDGRGGAIMYTHDRPTITKNIFRRNVAAMGGAFATEGTFFRGTLTYNVFIADTADTGGAVAIQDLAGNTSSQPCKILNNTVHACVGLEAADGVALLGLSTDQSLVFVNRNIFVGRSGGREQIDCFLSGSGVAIDSLACNDFWLSAGGIKWDSLGCSIGVGSQNFLNNPFFCSGDTLDSLYTNSACAPTHSPCGLLVGASGVKCSGGGGPGSGCPMLAVWNGSEYEEANNILPEAERIVEDPPYVHDVCPLNVEPAEDDGLIRLRLFEPEGDLSYLDRVGLRYADLPEQVELAVARSGDAVFYSPLAAPSVAEDGLGTDWADSLVALDSMAVGSSVDGAIVLTIPLEPGAPKALDDLGGSGSGSQKQIIYAKAPFAKWNSGDGRSQADHYGLGGGIEVALIGDAFPGGRVATDTLMPREYWSDQYIDFGSYLGAAGDSAHVELRWLGDHRLDRFVLAAPAEAPPVEPLQLVSATHSVLGDVKALLTTADSAYAVLDVGETIDLVFEAPDAPPNGTRRYLFDASGYYLLFEGKTGSERPVMAGGLPHRFLLRPAAPNPGTDVVRFRYELPEATSVRIQIYDVTGRAVATLLDGTRPAGYHGVVWDGSRIDGGRASAGIYFARMEAGNEVQTTKFVLVQ
jgi:hypothetical protein